MGKFIIAKRVSGDYQFRLIASNGQIILNSEGYTTKSACVEGVQSVVKSSQDDTNFIRKTSSNGNYYFNLKAINGQIIGTSQMYASEAGRESGIYSVKVNAKSNLVEIK